MAQVQPSDPQAPVASAGHPTAPLSGPALITAFVVLVAFTAFVWYMITQQSVAETTWSRLAWLFSSVEAIAFGAAGALFGSSIQRQRAEKAEAAAERNADTAAKGQALAASIKADDPGTAAGRSGLERLGATGQAGKAAEDLAARHAAIARELFP
jgi:uncharacterized membrane protein YsdA (DUF1294 family)